MYRNKYSFVLKSQQFDSITITAKNRQMTITELIPTPILTHEAFKLQQIFNICYECGIEDTLEVLKIWQQDLNNYKLLPRPEQLPPDELD